MIETTHLRLCTYIPISNIKFEINNVIKLLNCLLVISKNVRMLCAITLVYLLLIDILFFS